MGRRKRRRVVVVEEEDDDDDGRGRGGQQAVAEKRSRPSQKRAKDGRGGPVAVACAKPAHGAEDSQLEPVATLDDPRLAPCFAAAMRSLHLTGPTPVQSRCWPVCIARRDAVVIAPTGSGKTLGYVLPAAAVCLSTDEEELKHRPGASPIAVVVCPTRELAQQVHRVCRPLARLSPKLQAVCATGGVDKGEQMQELRAVTGPWGAPQLLVGTPGRLHDLLGGLSREDREQQLHEEWEQLQRESEQHAELPAGDDAVPGSIQSVGNTHGSKTAQQSRVAPGSSGLLSFAHVRFLVLDEMDKLLSMGNNYELQTIRSACDASCADSDPNSTNTETRQGSTQVLLFSATMPAVLKEAVAQWVTDPVRVIVRSSATTVAAKHAATSSRPDLAVDANKNSASDGDDKRVPSVKDTTDIAGMSTIERDGGKLQECGQNSDGTALTVVASVTQVVHVCAEHKKPKKLLTFVGKIRTEEKQNGARTKARILVFCNRIKTVKFIESLLRKNNHFCKQMSSAMNQTQREQTLGEFRCGKLPILIATDVAGRGLDVRGLEHVVNYDFPSRLEVYVHRAGRTGRQGADGQAYSFFGRHLSALAPELIRLLEATNQWIDPNLRALVPRNKASAEPQQPVTKKREGSDAAEDEGHSSDGLEQWSDSED